MIAMLVMGWKAVSTFIAQWRIYFYIAALGAAALTVFNYIDNHGEMKATIEANEQTMARQVENMRTLRLELQNRDQRIAAINAAKRIEVAQARRQIQHATELVEATRIENARIREALEVTRFETLEAMNDDESFNDWANEPVPVAGWSLLQRAADPRDD